MTDEITLGQALGRVKKELASFGVLVAALGGGGSWFGWDAHTGAKAAESTSADLVAFYAPALGQCRMQVEEQRKICLEMIENERSNTAAWQAQCGRE